MKKADLVQMLAEKNAMTKSAAEGILDDIFGTIGGVMAKADEFAMPGFGKFVGKNRAARKARNPRTGETVSVPATRVAKFSAAKALKEKVAGK